MEPSASIAAQASAHLRALIARALVGLAVALALLALTAASAAAAEPGDLVPGSAADALVDTVDSITAPVVEPVVEPLLQILEPAVPELPAPPIVPVPPVAPAVPTLPVVPIVPDLPTMPDPAAPDAGDAAGRRAAAARPVLLDALAPGLPGEPSDAGAVTVPSVAAKQTADPVDGPLAGARDVAASIAGLVTAAVFSADGGTTVLAATLIGLLVAVAGGWSSVTSNVRLRPIGLRLAPPVPPG